MRRTTRFIRLGVACAGVLTTLALFALSAKPANAQRPGRLRAQPVATVTARVETVQVVLESVGTVRAPESAVITAQATGVVGAIHFSDGQTVNAGDLLVTLERSEQQAAVRLAEVVLEGARRDLARAENLARQNAAPRERVDELRTASESAEALLQTARAQLEKRFIRAPFRGKLGIRQVSPGALVTPGVEITNIQSVEASEIVFTVPERAVGDVRVGQAVYAFPPRQRMVRITGRVITVDSRIDPASRSVAVVARTTVNSSAVRPGSFVNVELVTAQRLNVRLPEAAVYLEGAKTYAFVVREGKAVRTEVSIGERNGGKVEILSGVAPGDEVISSGIQKVRDGGLVQPIGRSAAGRPGT